MSTVVPESESLKRAVRWIADHFNESDAANKNEIIRDAVFRFDLTPKDTEFIYAMYRKKGTD